jgi:hypothetical protein
LVSSNFRIRQVVVAATMLVSMGCYTLEPVGGQALPLGTQVSLAINDAGRAALSGQMGPEISDIQGRLLQKDSAEYVLAVTQISLLRGGEQVWAGERIRVKTSYVNTISERRFSRSRTAVVSAVALGVVAAVFSQGILGNLQGDEGKPKVDTANANRIPRLIKR